MKEIKLADIFPAKPEITIEGKVFSIRAPNLYDRSWIEENLGGPEQVSTILQKQNWPAIAKLLYHLLDDAGQEYHRARTATIMNPDSGERVERHLTGPEVLLTKIHGPEGGMKLIGALCKAIADSNPLVEDVLKKSLEAANKQLAATPIGQKSSIVSKKSTAGKRSTLPR